MSAFRCVFPRQMSFTINKHRFILFRTTQGCDAMSYSNCTSNMGIVIWKCEVLVWHQSGIYSNPQRLIFQNTSSHFNLQHFPHSDNKNVANCARLLGGMGENSCHARCSNSEQLSVKPHTVPDPEFWVMYRILLYSHYIPILALVKNLQLSLPIRVWV